jgi:peptide/nickel transport system substrate-binding protein
MVRPIALSAAIAVALLAVSGAGGVDAQTPKRGGTVVIAVPDASEPSCLNWLVCDAFGGPGLLDLVLDGAFEVKPDATYRANLVSRAEIVSKQPFTLVFHIRPNADWSDGIPITASDFAFTYSAMRRYLPEAPESQKIRRVVELDAKTVKIVLRVRFPDWRDFFRHVLPRHALSGQNLASVWSDAIDDPRTRKPIGSGPFLLSHFGPGKQLTLVRNPRYWGPHPAYLDRVVWRFVPPTDAAEALRRGDVDMIDPSDGRLQDAALVVRRQQVPGVNVLSVLLSSWEHFDIRMRDGGHPALRNRLVRQALAYGIDRVEIARAIGELAGAGEGALAPLDSVVFMANSAHYQPDWNGYRSRPALARRLLERAGCRRAEDGIYSCAGERLSLRFVTSAGVARRERTIELAQAQLRRIGVEVRPVFAPPTIFLGTIVPSGDFDLALFRWITGASTSSASDIFGCQGLANFTGFCDRLMTRDLAQAMLIVDDKRRVKLVNKIDARLAKAVPAIPLYQNTFLFAFRATIRGVVPNGVDFFGWNAENWWLER